MNILDTYKKSFEIKRRNQAAIICFLILFSKSSQLWSLSADQLFRNLWALDKHQAK